jgi:sugar O-acyltransferase (sialic acid O-acetyltransferase NeuD family)
LLLLGGGGHCLSVLEAIYGGAYRRVAIVDLPARAGTAVHGVPVVGCDADLQELRREFGSAFVSLGSVGNWRRREELFRRAAAFGYAFLPIVHPKANVSRYAALSEGVFVGMGAQVNADCAVGLMCIVNTGSVLDHECTLSPFVHIAPGAALCGHVTVGLGSHVGAGSVVRQNIAIGENVLIGVGSVVTRDIPDNVVAYGNPCRVIRGKEWS